MPKVFKTEAEKNEANNKRLHKQKLANACYQYEKKVLAEINRPHCYKKFRDNFMSLVVGTKKYSIKNYYKHIKYCSIEDVYEAFEYGAEHCICAHSIKIVAMVRYKNPNNGKQLVFNVGTSCILNCEDDILKEDLTNKLLELKKKAYTCQYCNKICLHLDKSGRAHNNFNIREKQCEQCSTKHWCRFCKKNIKQQPWHSKCKPCWMDANGFT